MVPTELNELVHHIIPILRSHGVVRASVFGSFARGTQREASDLDLLVEFAEGRGLLDQAALEADLSEHFGREVEVITYRALNPYIRESALRDQVVIL
ncbi:MAG TPA: nucleotidyltransferase family protein [Ktedonobacterales bacterium]|nr:nucleotidyltransferase family protein [Ktedonobacterales bacterium]